MKLLMKRLMVFKSTVFPSVVVAFRCSSGPVGTMFATRGDIGELKMVGATCLGF